MEPSELNVVTGAFGYTGKHIASRLLAEGKRVVTLTGHPGRPNPFNGRVSVAPLDFDNLSRLAMSMEGATTLFNTYWVRLDYGQATYAKAVANTGTLIRAAREAGVRRIVHISVTNNSESSPLPYFRGKALLEKEIAGSGLSYAMIRPALIFGDGDILINNIAWILKRFPVFAVPGSGDYKLRPIFVGDLAQMAIDVAQNGQNMVIDAVGPEVYSFNDLVHLMAKAVGSSARIIHLKPKHTLRLAKLIGSLVGDVVLTHDELEGLMAGLLLSDGPSTGETHLSDWLFQNAGSVGARYASELEGHYRH